MFLHYYFFLNDSVFNYPNDFWSMLIWDIRVLFDFTDVLFYIMIKGFSNFFMIYSYIFLFSLIFYVSFLLRLLYGNYKVLYLLFYYYFYQNYFAIMLYILDNKIKAQSIHYLLIQYRTAIFKDLNIDLDNNNTLVYNSIFWWEPWSYEIVPYFPPFSKKFFNSPWHFYYKFLLSTWLRWHILEDRICIFVLFFIWLLL